MILKYDTVIGSLTIMHYSAYKLGLMWSSSLVGGDQPRPFTLFSLWNFSNCEGLLTRSVCISNQGWAGLFIRSLWTCQPHPWTSGYHGALLPNSDISVHCLPLGTDRGSYHFTFMKLQQHGKGNLFCFPHLLFYLKSQNCKINFDPLFQTEVLKWKKCMCDNLPQNSKSPGVREGNIMPLTLKIFCNSLHYSVIIMERICWELA